MTSYRVCFLFFVLTTQTCVVFGLGEIAKSSLTFVIDDSASMIEEITQVKDEVNIIFEKVLTSSASQIENFVLVTFNDPDANLRTITKEREEFKRALASINAYGGGDCPEYALKGIEIGLKQSLPLSYIYVFTDASAKDYNRFDEIKSLAQKKQSQIVFLLTGDCESLTDDAYRVYYKIAEATSGQVFHMVKDDIKDVLKYIEETITGRGITLVNKKIPSGYGIIKYTVPPHSGDVLISVTGKEPKIGLVTGPGGRVIKTVPVISDKAEMAVVRVIAPEPGDHKVEVSGKSETHAVITAKTSFNVQLGFSVLRPTSMKDTVTKPAPEGNGFLGIRVLGDGVKVTKAKILDMSNNVIMELPLELVDGKAKFYVTPSFYPPNTTFRVSAVGYDVESKLPIEITSATPIERQNPKTEKADNTAPQIKIDGSPVVTTEYDEHLQLKCRVHAYPKPEIIWEEKDTGTKIPATVQLVEVPYDYISILDVEKSNKNITYQCKASNSIGVNITYVEVQTHKKQSVSVNGLGAPKLFLEPNIKVTKGRTAFMECKVLKGVPAPNITWFSGGPTGTNFTPIPSSRLFYNVLTISKVEEKHGGKYKCVAENDVGKDERITTLIIRAPPKITSNPTTVYGIEGDLALRIPCEVDAVPRPVITWKIKGVKITPNSKYIIEDGDLVIKNPTINDTAAYTCEAKNRIGSDSATFEVNVDKELPDFGTKHYIYLPFGETRKIECEAYKSKSQSIKWFKELINQEGKYEHLQINKASFADDGNYTCHVSDEHGHVQTHTYVVEVGSAPKLYTPKNLDDWHGDIQEIKSNCEVSYAKPDAKIKWYFNGKELTDKEVPEIGIRYKWGHYTCTASNIYGSVKNSFDVKSSVCLIPRNLRDAAHMPLVLTNEGTWPKWDFKDKYTILEQNEIITLSCPNQKETSNTFRNFGKQSELKAICLKEDTFVVNGKNYKLSDLQCTNSMHLSILREQIECSKRAEKPELVQVGFNVTDFLGIYDICFDHAKNLPLYAHASMIKTDDSIGTNNKWYTYPGIGDTKIERGFTCKDSMTSCCYGKSQLLNAKNFNYEIVKRSTFIDYLNGIPIWRPCSPSQTKWEDIDDMIRKQLDGEDELITWTGTYTYEKKHGAIIPRYLWKVLFGHHEQLAIVHVNSGSPTEDDIKCENVCNEDDHPWFSVSDEYTYCCSLTDFLEAFDIHGTKIGG